MLNDLRYALRNLRGNRLFTAMAVLSLALGIGANTAIYSFMDAILVRTLPVQDPGALVVLRWHSTGERRPPIIRGINGSNWNDPELGRMSPNFPYRAFEILSKDNPVLQPLAGFNNGWGMTALIKQQGSAVQGLFVSGAFFGTLGLPPAAGRLIGMEDDREGAAAVAVISHGFAERRFGGAAQAIGETAVVNNVPFTIVGVTPPSFYGINPGQSQDVYMPQRASILVDRLLSTADPRAKYNDPRRYWCEMLGRLRPGVTIAKAQAALAPVFHQFATNEAVNDAERANLPKLVVADASHGLNALRRRYSKPLFFLTTLVGLILAIACANLANLLLARSAGRRREMAVRLSLGAGRARIIRQLLTESLLLASLGAAIGLVFAWWGIQGLAGLLGESEQSFIGNGLNWRVLAVTMGLAGLTGVLFGLAPALQSTRVDLTSALKQTRAGESRKRFAGWLRVSLSQSLVVSQIAVSLLLLVAAGLFVRTMSKLNAVELGFNRERLLVFNVNARQAGYSDENLKRFFRDLHGRLGAIPGVQSATASVFALVSNTLSSGGITVPGYTGNDPEAAFLSVAPNFFRTFEIPVLLGRPIEERDVDGAAKVAVVNEAFVRRFYTGQNPIGRRFSVGRGPTATEVEIIGVSRNARYDTIKGEMTEVAYFPYTYSGRADGALTFELRTAGDPMGVANAAREVVRQADSRIPVTEMKTQDAIINTTIGQERTFAALCTAFALLAVVIACVGLYGTMAYSVARRTNELGLRMALGAERQRLIWMVLREVFVMAGAGLAIGVPVALATTKFVKSFLFELTPNDPLAISGAAVVLVLAAIAAGYGPAWRASRIDPWNALRHE